VRMQAAARGFLARKSCSGRRSKSARRWCPTRRRPCCSRTPGRASPSGRR
jgi:hypothetical protein